MVERYKLLVRNGMEIEARCGRYGRGVRFAPESAGDESTCPFCKADLVFRRPTDYRTAPCKTSRRPFTFLPEIVVEEDIDHPQAPPYCSQCAKNAVNADCPYCRKWLVLGLKDLELGSRPCPFCRRKMVAVRKCFFENEGHQVIYEKRTLTRERVGAVCAVAAGLVFAVRACTTSVERNRERMELRERSQHQQEAARESVSDNRSALIRARDQLEEVGGRMTERQGRLAAARSKLDASEPRLAFVKEQVLLLAGNTTPPGRGWRARGRLTSEGCLCGDAAYDYERQVLNPLGEQCDKARQTYQG